jgi:hypothetical protein
MVWIALALLALTATIVTLITLGGHWGMGHWRWGWLAPADGALPHAPGMATWPKGPPDKGLLKGPIDMRPPRYVVSTFDQTAAGLEALPHLVPAPPAATALETAAATAWQASLRQTGFYVFSRSIVLSVFVGFLLPIWSLSFATEALGGEREGRSLVWLLSRPLPRPAIYLAKFVALLPWALVLNVGGFGLLCLLAGGPGHLAFSLYWPAVLGATLAFCSLFHLMGACFRRSAVVALVYSFFLETILGNMPGVMKRVSVSFYTRCLMFEAAGDYGVQREKPSIYLPVEGATAWIVLVGMTVVLLLVGMVIFARSEYQDLT